MTTNRGPADLFNDFFASVFVNDPAGHLPIFYVRYGLPVTRTRTDSGMVKKQLKYLNMGKSMGPDGRHPRLFRETRDIISFHLKKSFDKTFYKGKSPKSGKMPMYRHYVKQGR